MYANVPLVSIETAPIRSSSETKLLGSIFGTVFSANRKERRRARILIGEGSQGHPSIRGLGAMPLIVLRWRKHADIGAMPLAESNFYASCKSSGVKTEIDE